MSLLNCCLLQCFSVSIIFEVTNVLHVSDMSRHKTFAEIKCLNSFKCSKCFQIAVIHFFIRCKATRFVPNYTCSRPINLLIKNMFVFELLNIEAEGKYWELLLEEIFNAMCNSVQYTELHVNAELGTLNCSRWIYGELCENEVCEGGTWWS